MSDHDDLLRHAAAHIRQHLEGVTKPPWMSASETNRKNSIALVGAVAKQGTGEAIAVLAGNPLARHYDARWIGLMHPAVGEPLAVLFERAAESMVELGGLQRTHRITEPHLAHLADLMEVVRVARVVLRETEEVPA